MKNEQLIKSAHVWALAILLACGVVGFAASGLRSQTEDSTQSFTSQTSQNQNSNKNSKLGTDQARGSQVGMANLNTDERNFVMEAAMGGMMEVELGKLAAQQGTSDVVKQFGQRMVDDHSKANMELQQVASSKGLTLPTGLDEKHKNELAKYSKMTGPEFDKAYSKAMLSDHVKDVAAFEKESTKGNDADIKAFASKTLPTLREHLDMAKAMNGQKGAGPKNSKSNN